MNNFSGGFHTQQSLFDTEHRVSFGIFQAFFRVQGTNKTLKRMVILEATLDNSPAAFTAAKSAGHPASVAPRQPGGTVPPKKDEGAKSSNHNLGAIRAIARMRVLGNARIEKANYRIDAYQRAAPAPAKPDVKPTEAKEK